MNHWMTRCHHYLTALRPGSFTASLTPVTLGCILAYKTSDTYSLLTLVVTALTVCAVHAAGNLVNTYCDYIKGIDSQRRSDDRTLVDHLLTPEEVVHLGVAAYVIACIGFFGTVYLRPERLELLALVFFCGFSLSFGYSGGGLKYIALGDVLIVVTFGPVVVLFSYIAQTGTFNQIPLLYAIPLALNTEAILHSNNTRDMESDRKAGGVTLAVLLGQSGSHVLFALLLFIPYILFCVLSIRYSPWLVLPLITIRQAFKLEKNFRDGNLRQLPLKMIQLNRYFGAFYLISCYLSSPEQLPGIGLV